MDDETLSFDDRMWLALDQLRLTHERNDGQVRENDVLNAATAWSTPVDFTLDDDAFLDQPALTELNTLRDTLFAVLANEKGR